jgi:hypothetical protein
MRIPAVSLRFLLMGTSSSARFYWTTKDCDAGVEVLVNDSGHIFASIKPYQGGDGRGGYMPHYTRLGGGWVRMYRVSTRSAARRDIYRRLWGKLAEYHVDETNCIQETTP